MKPIFAGDDVIAHGSHTFYSAASGVSRKKKEWKKQQRDNLEGENGEQNNCLNEILDVYTWKHDRRSQKTSSLDNFFFFLRFAFFNLYYEFFFLSGSATMMPYAKNNNDSNIADICISAS
jgi:hypothetical protein